MATKKRSKKTETWCVTVCYPGYGDVLLEKAITEAVGMRAVDGGSGYCFVDKERDIEFLVEGRAAAIAAAKRAKKVKRGLKVVVEGRVWP